MNMYIASANWNAFFLESLELNGESTQKEKNGLMHFNGYNNSLFSKTKLMLLYMWCPRTL